MLTNLDGTFKDQAEAKPCNFDIAVAFAEFERLFPETSVNPSKAINFLILCLKRADNWKQTQIHPHLRALAYGREFGIVGKHLAEIETAAILLKARAGRQLHETFDQATINIHYSEVGMMIWNTAQALRRLFEERGIATAKPFNPENFRETYGFHPPTSAFG